MTTTHTDSLRDREAEKAKRHRLSTGNQQRTTEEAIKALIKDLINSRKHNRNHDTVFTKIANTKTDFNMHDYIVSTFLEFNDEGSTIGRGETITTHLVQGKLIETNLLNHCELIAC